MKIIDEVKHHIAHFIDLGIGFWCGQDKIVLIKQSDEIDLHLITLLRCHSKPCYLIQSNKGACSFFMVAHFQNGPALSKAKG